MKVLPHRVNGRERGRTRIRSCDVTKGICIVDTCPDPARTRGLCGAHYHRLLRHGDPLGGDYRGNGTPMERFLAYAIRPDDEDACHGWRCRLQPGRYATLGVDGRRVRAHRWIWEQTYGPIPEGMIVDHVCHNEAAARGECAAVDDCPHRACTNIRHLVLKTVSENNWASPNFTGNSTHCKHGHEYTEANTYRRRNGSKHCRECHLQGQRKRYAARTRGAR